MHSFAVTITLMDTFPNDICEGSSFQVCLRRNGDLETTILVDITRFAADVTSNPIMFTPDNGLTQCFTITIVDDTEVENFEDLTFLFTTPNSLVALPSGGTVTINDDDRELN